MMAGNLPRLCLLLLLLLVGGLLVPRSAHANVVCSVTSQGINFGTVNVSTSTGATSTGSVGYKCTNYATTPANFTLCVKSGNNPSYPGSTSQPQMSGGTPPLKFNLYTNAPNGLVWSGTNFIATPVSIAGGNGNVVSGFFTFYGYIPGNQASPAGTYSASFYNTLLGFVSGTQCGALSGYSGLDFTLSVQATVGNVCVVSAGTPLNFGSQPSTATNITGSNLVSVSCPTGTSYNVGLAPSNGNTAGAGVMGGTNGNTDKVPYQLHSGSLTGPVWGNTATSTNTGNGVAGTGIGSGQSLIVYAVLAGANFKPDTYSDTVTVYVNY